MFCFLVCLISVLCLLCLILKSLVIVNDEEEAVIERIGQFDRVIGKGVHFILPFFENLRGIEDRLGHSRFFNNKKISLSSQKILFPKDNRFFYSKNNEQLKIEFEVVYRITDPYKAVYEVTYLVDALNQLVCGVIQKRLLDTNQSETSVVLKDIFKTLADVCNEYSVNWGVKIENIKLLNLIK